MVKFVISIYRKATLSVCIRNSLDSGVWGTEPWLPPYWPLPAVADVQLTPLPWHNGNQVRVSITWALSGEGIPPGQKSESISNLGTLFVTDVSVRYKGTTRALAKDNSCHHSWALVSYCAVHSKNHCFAQWRVWDRHFCNTFWGYLLFIILLHNEICNSLVALWKFKFCLCHQVTGDLAASNQTVLQENTPGTSNSQGVPNRSASEQFSSSLYALSRLVTQPWLFSFHPSPSCWFNPWSISEPVSPSPSSYCPNAPTLPSYCRGLLRAFPASWF